MTQDTLTDAQEGSSVFLQHVMWMLGYPETWIAIAAWLLFLGGTARLAFVLRKLGRNNLLAALLVGFVAFMICYAWAWREVFQIYVEGGMATPVARILAVLNWLVLGLGALSGIWIARDALKGRSD